MTILPWISFDRLLEDHHNEKENLVSASQAEKRGNTETDPDTFETCDVPEEHNIESHK